MIFADTAYYKQPHRKLAIISGNYKYIYNKLDNSEELYDVAFDPNEGINLLSDMYKDSNRNLIYPLRDLLTYPEWDELHLFLDEAREEKKRIWKQDGPIVAMLWKIRHQLGVLEGRLDTFIKNKLAAKK
jgi:arylsulfatase A-like enzyme